MLVIRRRTIIRTVYIHVFCEQCFLYKNKRVVQKCFIYDFLNVQEFCPRSIRDKSPNAKSALLFFSWVFCIFVGAAKWVLMSRMDPGQKSIHQRSCDFSTRRFRTTNEWIFFGTFGVAGQRTKYKKKFKRVFLRPIQI